MNGALTVFTSETPTTLGKVFQLGGDGVLVKDTAGQMVEGTFQVREFNDVEGLGALLATVGTNQAISASVPRNGAGSGCIVTKDAKPTHPGALSRTKDDFGFAVQPGVMVLDYDPPATGEALTRDALWAVVVQTAPGLKAAGVLWWCSGSSHIFEGEVERQGLRGQRLYILVENAADIPRAFDTLDARLWLAGHGRVVISASGQRLVRGLFDATMSEAGRLDFIGGAVCRPPLEQRRGNPVVLGAGGFIDSMKAIPELSVFERQRADTLKAEARAAAEPAAKAQRERWAAGRVVQETGRLVKKGVGLVEARDRAERTIRAAAEGLLLGDFPLILDDGAGVTVGDVLDAKEKYHGRLCRDPLEPEYLGSKVCGKLYLYGGAPTLTSRAHGGQNFRLRRQPAAIEVPRGRLAELADTVAERLAAEGDVFARGGVLVLVQPDGSLRRLTKASVRHLVGTRFALVSRNARNEPIPADLPGDCADMVLALVGGGAR